MQFNNEDDNISWSSPPKKKICSTDNKWRVPNFEIALQTKKSRPFKQKPKSSRRKFEFSSILNVNLNTPDDTEVLSPVLNKKKYESPTEECGYVSPVLNDELNTSPVKNDNLNLLIPHNSEFLSPVLKTKIHKRPAESLLNVSPVLSKKRNQSDSEVDRSPVLNRKDKLKKLAKSRLNKINNCTRQLTQLQDNNELTNYTRNNILQNFEIEPVIQKPRIENKLNVNNNKSTIDKHVDKKIFINFAWKFKPEEENSQEISDNTLISANNKSITSKHKTYKQHKREIEPTIEKVDIEEINSQEETDILPSNSKIETKSTVRKLSPVEKAEIEVINSQEILTLNIEKSQSSRKTSEDEICVIESVGSQTSSLITISSNGTIVQDSLEKSSEEYQFSPRKKKKYKPGTTAHQFHKLLRKQRADVAIWKHELYLTSTSNYQIPATKEDHLITNMKICKMFVDFGTNIWECCDLNEEKCLVIANISFLDNLSVKNGDIIKIIPPFYIKYILVNNINVKSFINVHKIMKL